MTEKIIQTTSARKVGPDILIWKSTINGSFITASALELNRVKSEVVKGSNWFWHPVLRMKILVCLWKAKYNCL